MKEVHVCTNTYTPYTPSPQAPLSDSCSSHFMCQGGAYMHKHIRVHEPYMGFARIFQKIPHLIPRRPNFIFQMQDFEGYKLSKKSICAGLSARVFPHRNCHLASFFIFCTKKNSKQFKKNALDIIRVLLKDESITIDIVSQLKKFLDFSWGVTPFCENKGSQKLDPTWDFFCCEPLKCSGPNKVVSQNIYLNNLN